MVKNKGINKKCMMYNNGLCNSDYRKNKLCNLSKCPYKFGGSYAMAVYDMTNRIKDKNNKKRTMNDDEYLDYLINSFKEEFGLKEIILLGNNNGIRRIILENEQP